MCSSSSRLPTVSYRFPPYSTPPERPSSSSTNSPIYHPATSCGTPILNALVVFDFKDADWEGPMLRRIRDAMQSGIPVFCEKKVLLGLILHSSDSSDFCSGSHVAKEKIKEMLCQSTAPFDILAVKNNGEQLFILPRSYYGSLQLKDKLVALGIRADQAVKVDPQELFQSQTDRQSSICNFQEFFEPTSRTKLRFYLAGHGVQDSSIAGLPLSDYSHFLSFMNQMNCEVLTIDSCSSGGINRKYQTQTKYPLLVKSIGNFTTYYTTLDFGEYFKKMDNILRHPRGLTMYIFRKILATSRWVVPWKNLMQVRLPTSRYFVPLNEDNSAIVMHKDNSQEHRGSLLTYGRVRVLELIQKKIVRPLLLQQSRPVILSMLSYQKPVHIFSDVTTEHTLMDFLSPTIEAYKEDDEVGQHQPVILFKKLTTKDTRYESVFLICYSRSMWLQAYDTTKNQYLSYPLNSKTTNIPNIVSRQSFLSLLKTHIPARGLSD